MNWKVNAEVYLELCKEIFVKTVNGFSAFQPLTDFAKSSISILDVCQGSKCNSRMSYIFVLNVLYSNISKMFPNSVSKCPNVSKFYLTSVFSKDTGQSHV